MAQTTGDITPAQRQFIDDSARPSLAFDDGPNSPSFQNYNPNSSWDSSRGSSSGGGGGGGRYNLNQGAGTASTQSQQPSSSRISDEQYAKLGQDAWGLANNNDWYGKGWLNLGDYGGSDRYQFAYDDSQNIGVADDDPMRYLYVKDMQNPENVKQYRLGSSQDPNIDMAALGRNLYGGGNNMLSGFWSDFYKWGQNPVQQPTYPEQPPITPPTGVYPDQGAVTQPDGGQRVPGPGMGEPMKPEDALDIGTGTAQKILQDMMNMPQYYPGWWGNDYQKLDAAKWQEAFPEFLDVPQYEGIDLPGEYLTL